MQQMKDDCNLITTQARQEVQALLDEREYIEQRIKFLEDKINILESQPSQVGEYVQVETNVLDMEKCVTKGIKQAIKEFKDTYPNSSDLNLMFNTKQTSLEADMDSKKDLLISMLDIKTSELKAFLISTKVAHTHTHTHTDIN